ncbi:unnamed protein product [Pseudo-nitzschia multistriata]|uniref:Peptidase S1 domain-containing protein n=1 Tax=Pseudo-nitzschia multistriata TaxID=183589 RepID=A0A448ZHC9_9STRA|nr:unnamed protein product [Pseudo-nitzschia multistriata]
MEHSVKENTSHGLKKFIINGQNSDFGRYPYHALLMHETGKGYCGGTLIAPDVILTAAHCEIPVWVGVGRHFRHTYSDGDELHRILYSYRHPYFFQQTFDFDLILLKLRDTSAKPPIRLNDDPKLPDVSQGSAQNVVTVAGFGKTHHGYAADTIQEVNLNMISNDVCEESRDPYSNVLDFQIGYEGLIFDNMFCLADLSESGKDACSGKLFDVMVEKKN